jgi:hypothetical protein
MSQNPNARGPRGRQPLRGTQRPVAPQPPVAAHQPPRPSPEQPVPPPPPQAFADESQYDEFWDTLDEAPPARQTLMARLRRLPPFVVLFSAASVVSVAFLALSLASRSIEFPVLIAAAVVTGIVFAADTAAFARVAYLAGEDGRSGRALLLALAGGTAAVLAGLSFGWAAVMVLLSL